MCVYNILVYVFSQELTLITKPYVLKRLLFFTCILFMNSFVLTGPQASHNTPLFCKMQ